MTCKVNADTTNGLKLTSDTSGAIDLQSNGTTRVSMDASGNVTATSFIGDGSSLTGVAGLPDAIDVNASAPADSLNIDASGNVGIGTLSPNAKLHIHGGDQTTANIDTSSASNIVLNVAGTGTTAGSGGAMVFSASDGAWRFASIKGLVADGGSNTVGHLAFSVRNSPTNSTLTEAMRINYSGNVGIGTSSPSQKLDVNGTINATAFATSPVLSAIAGLSFGAVGTFCFARRANNTTAGTTYGGIQLRTAGLMSSGFNTNAYEYNYGGTLSGTWRSLGTADDTRNNNPCYTIYVRIV